VYSAATHGPLTCCAGEAQRPTLPDGDDEHSDEDDERGVDDGESEEVSDEEGEGDVPRGEAIASVRTLPLDLDDRGAQVHLTLDGNTG
jgi:hypothetical protein